MANAKKNATKKVATKKTSTRKIAQKLTTFEQAQDMLDFSTMYVVSERKLLTWTPLVVLPTRSEAEQFESLLEEGSGVSFNKYKVDRVHFQKQAVYTTTDLNGAAMTD